MRFSSHSSSRVSAQARSSNGRLRVVGCSAAVIAIAALGAARPASAAINLFTNGSGTGTWEDAGNWIAGAPPLANQSGFIDSGYSVTSSGAANVCDELQVGVGTNSYGSNGNPGGTGILSLLDGSTLTTSGNMVVGQSQTSDDTSGIINIASGATLNVKGANTLLGFFGSNVTDPTVGTVNVNGGTFNTNAGNNRGTIWIGGDSLTNKVGTGVLNMNSGAVNAAAVRVGDCGVGTLNVAGGTFNSNFYMSIGLGNNPNAGGGTVNITGGVMNLAQMTVNERKVNDCVVTQTGGTVNIGNVTGLDGYNFRVGLSTLGKGIYNMSGGTLNVAGTDLLVGGGLNGLMNISGTSVITVNASTVAGTASNYGFALGGTNNGTAVVNQTGGSVTISPTSLLGVFFKGTAGGTSTYNLAGGTLTTGGISADSGTTVKTFNFDGGTLIANKDFTVPNPARVAAPTGFFTTISAGGATINSNGFAVTWVTPLTGAGALTKIGDGALTLSGVNTYGGATTISGGTLLASNTAAGSATGAGTVTVASGATLGGTGTVGGNATISGTVAPGAVDVTGALSFGSALTFNAGSAAAIQLASSTDVDHVAVAGTATLAGAAKLTALAGYVPAYGQTHRVLDAASVVGHFTTIEGNQLSTNRWLAVTYDATGVNVTAALPGDADLNLAVGFSDLVRLAQNYNQTSRVWVQGDFNGSGTVDFADLVVLAQHYNGTATAGSITFDPGFAADWELARSLAPEPTTVVLLAVPLALAARRRKSVSQS